MTATTLERLKYVAASTKLSVIESAVINAFLKHPNADGLTTSTLLNLTGVLFSTVITNQKFKDSLAQQGLKIRAHRVNKSWVYTLQNIEEETTEPRE